MAKITRGAKQVGSVDIDGTTYDLIQIQRAVWVVHPVKDTTIDRLRDRDAVLKKYPRARFTETGD